MKLAFIGTGNMGGALAKAAANCPDAQLLLANRHPEKARLLSEAIGGRVCSSQEAAAEADYIFLGVKPQMMAQMLSQIRDSLAARAGGFVLVSMAAATGIAEIQAMAGGSYPVIRIMPNTPVSVGQGMILYCHSGNVSQDQLEGFLNVMSGAGRFLPMEEKMLDCGSSVSGCGPAFAAMFIEAMADGGVACGLPRAQAMEMAAQMMLGTAALYLDSRSHPGDLKDRVCSPGGTTIQGVRALEKGGFRSAIIEAVIATFEKNSALMKG